MTANPIKSLDGQEFQAYIAIPDAQNGPGLIVIPEFFGVNESMRQICDSFAAAGYIAACPDLFWRQEPGLQLNDAAPEEWPRAFEMYKSFDIEAGVRDLLATLAFLRRYPGCSGLVGTLGYGLGGKLAFLMGARSDVECSVSYYGMGLESSLDEMSDIRMPLLLHLAENDKFIPTSVRQRLSLKASRNPAVQVELHPGADHGFARPTSPAYKEAEAQKAATKTDGFLAEFLRDKVR